MSDEYVYPAHLDPQRAKLPQTTNYLDDVQRREAEVQRARVEGREPDLENPPATSSTPLVKAGRLFDHPRNTLDRTLAKPVVLGDDEPEVVNGGSEPTEPSVPPTATSDVQSPTFDLTNNNE